MLNIETVNAYELPASYDDNRLVLLARDPHWLYAYWDIDPALIESFRHEFGNDIWDKSAPYLRINNITKNKEFHIRVNDFSNSWYINAPEQDCLYTAEIGRKVGERFFISLAASNLAATPRDNESQNTELVFVNYRNPGEVTDINSGINPNAAAELFKLNVTDGPSSLELLSSDLFEALVSSEDVQEKPL